MASQTINKTMKVKVEYTGVIDDLLKSLGKVKKATKEASSLTTIDKGMNKLLSIQKQIEAKGGLLNAEEAKLFGGQIERVIKSMGTVSKELFSQFSVDGQKAITEIAAKIKDEALKLGGKKRSLAASEKRVSGNKKDGFVVDETNKSFIDSTEKQAFEDVGLDSGKKARTERIEAQKKLNEEIKKSTVLNDEERAIIRDVTSDEHKRIEIADKLAAQDGQELTSAQILENLDNQHNIALSKEKAYEKEIAKQVKLQEEITIEQLELDKKRKKQTELIVAETKNLSGIGMDFDKDKNDLLLKTKKITKDITAEGKKRLKAEKEALATGKKGVKVIKEQEGALKKATKQVLSYGLAFTILRRLYRETIQTVTELDEALTEMSIVTTMSRKDTWELVGTMQTLAKETGFTTTEIAKLSTVYFRQGRNLVDVIELTTVAAKAARIAGISAAESADFLTSAVNGFGLAASEALAVSDKFAALAASSASSYEELAKGLSKFAAQANVAGLSMNFALGMLAKGVETTREAPETIGTALKTVLARLRELTDYGKTLEDGMDVNRVETALGAMNVELMDSNGQFRDMESVLTDLGGIWDTLNTNQQASIAVALAGTRQQSRLIAVMQDFDRTLELVDTAEDSAGATMAQHVEYMRSMEAAMVGLQNAWQEFITTISDSDFIIGIVNGLAQGMLILGDGLEKVGASGSTAMIIVIGLAVGMKALNIVTAMNAKITAFAAGGQVKLTMAQGWTILSTKLLQRATIRNYIALAAATKQTFTALIASEIHAGALSAEAGATLIAAQSTSYFNAVLALNPLVWIIGLVVAATLAFGYFSKAADKAAASFKKMSEEIAAANFELAQTNKKIDGLTEKIDELNKMSFLTDKQKEELKTLKTSLGEVLPDDIPISYLKDGITIDYENSIDVIRKYYEDNEQEQIDNRRELAAASIEKNNEKMDWGTQTIGEYIRDRKKTNTDRVNFDESTGTDIQRQSLVNFYMDEYKESLGDGYEELTDAELSAYRSYLNDSILNNPEEMLGYSQGTSNKFNNSEDYLVSAAKEFLGESEGISKFISKAYGEIEDESLTFSKKLSNMKDLLISSNADERVILYNQYSELVGMAENFSDDQISAMEKIGFTEVDDIQKGLELYGDEMGDLITKVKTKADKLIADGMDDTQAYSAAWSSVSRTTADATKKVWLYAQAFSDTILEAAQTLDSIQSKIENINKIQKEWMEGSLSNQDLYSFFEDNGDLFQTMEDVNRFLSGGGIDDQRFIAAMEAEQESIAGLYHYQMLLNRETEGTTEYQAALVKVGYYQALLQSTSALATLTIEQQKYNNELEQYEILTKMGIEDSIAQARLDEARLVFTQTAINGTIKGMADIESRFRETASSVQGLAGGFKDYFEVVNGVVVPLYDEMNNLTDKQMEYLTDMMNEYQDQLTESFDVFQDLRDSELEAEKEKLDAMKDAYTKYFKDIDALEKAASTKKTREDIVAQLQRLEGATDERSRQKALDLRKELNTLDEKTAADSTKDARAAMLESFDERYEELVTQWAEVGQQFISDMASGGSAAADAMLAKLYAAGLITEEQMNAGVGNGDGTKIDPIDPSDTTGIGEAIKAESKEKWKTSYVNGKLEAKVEELSSTPEAKRALRTGNVTMADIRKEAKGILDREFEALYAARQADSGGAAVNKAGFSSIGVDAPGFAKGGVVDYTGLAKLHGSKSSPEMVLDAAQTEMFMNLRDALGRISLGGGSNESINIEKIEIKTDKLNAGQDFDAAGKILAGAFNKAIKNRGITTNVKR